MSKKKGKRLSRPARLIAAAGMLLFAVIASAGLLWAAIAYFGLRPFVSVEYGTGLPDPSVFGERAVSYADAPSKPPLGTSRIRIRLKDGGERTVFLTAKDTTAPTATGLERTISTKTVLAPTDLIENLTDADKVWVEWAEEPPFGTVGDYPVTVLLEDISGNRAKVDAWLHIRVTNGGVTVEAGDEAPAARDFLMDDYTVSAIDGLDETALHTPGTHTVWFTIDGQDYPGTLNVTDTRAPEAETQTLFVAPGTPVAPEDFLMAVRDGSAVTATFLNEPDPDDRAFQHIGIRLTDLAGNTTDVTAGLLFTEVQPVTVEARNTPLTVADCLPGREADAVLTQTFVPDRVGTYSLFVLVNGEQELAIVHVVDSTAPALAVRDRTLYLHHPVSVGELVDSVTDVSETTLSVSEIDWNRAGAQEVTVTAEDAYGNRSEATFTLTLVSDGEPPVLYGVRDRIQYVGEPVAYLAEVFAVDALDGPVEVTVDASRVHSNDTGFYPVTYTATDSDGNTATATCRFTFVRTAVSAEELHALAAEVVDAVTTPQMTRTEKLAALYDYVYSHVRYNGVSDKNDWRKEAANGIRLGLGDCFTFYATLRALLDETDIQYMSVTRKGGASRHFWLLVNVGTGWYHLDANNNAFANWRCFMWTNEQCAYPPGFWNFEQSVYPAVATEPFSAEAVIAMEKDGTLFGQ